jgi:hypothetical protein
MTKASPGSWRVVLSNRRSDRRVLRGGSLTRGRNTPRRDSLKSGRSMQPLGVGDARRLRVEESAKGSVAPQPRGTGGALGRVDQGHTARCVPAQRREVVLPMPGACPRRGVRPRTRPRRGPSQAIAERRCHRTGPKSSCQVALPTIGPVRSAGPARWYLDRGPRPVG